MALDLYKRSSRTLAATFLAYALLVGINLGEFWPFSIYPMFSQGGIPWSRAVVRDVSDDTSAVRWQDVRAPELPGQPYPLLDYGISPIDLANFVSKSTVWHDERVAGLRRMFGESELERRSLLVVRVNGRITPEDSVDVSFVPYVLMAGDTTRLHPDLNRIAAE